MRSRWIRWICVAIIMLAVPLTGTGAVADVPISSSFLMDGLLYEMYINDVPVGVFSHASAGLKLYDEMANEKLGAYDDSVFLDNTVYFKETAEKTVTDEADVRAAIDAQLEVMTRGWAIMVDGKPVLYVSTDEDAQAILDALQAPYRDRVQSKGSQLTNITFKENVTFEKCTIPYEQLTTDIGYAVNYLATGMSFTETYMVRQGDNLIGIAQQYGMTISALQLANPGLDVDASLQPGQELLLTAVSPIVTVVTEEIYIYRDEIPFSVINKDDSTLYKGLVRLMQSGREGLKKVTVNIRRENGNEIKRDNVRVDILRNAVNEIKIVGTLDPPPQETVSRGDYTALSHQDVQMTPWFDSAQYVIPRGAIAKVTHVDTGITFWVKRRGGHYHADCEPLTAYDTEQMRRIYRRWSWNRNAVIVQVEGSTIRMAASMNGMPHGQGSINNNFPGHFCIHFLGSYTHVSGTMCPLHQACIRHAAGLE